MDILFLPGASGHGSFWDPVRHRLAGYDSATVDWPGLGDIAASPHVTSYEDLVTLTINVLDPPPRRSRSAATALVGQSMGGWVAARVAVARPDLVSHLVLVAASAGVDNAAFGPVDWRLDARRNRPDAPEWSFADHAPMEDELSQLNVPTLVLSANADPISPLAVGRRLHELLPPSELLVYESVEHWFALDFADDVALRINDWIAAEPGEISGPGVGA